MTLNIKSIPLFLILIANVTFAQTTAIPDENFERALIDMNIDSDGIVNGQVFTADIENIVELDFGSLVTEEIFFDLTGIEDFTALEILDFAEQGVYLFDPSNANIFSNNINLKELTMKNQCGDCGGVLIQVLDLSGLPHLEYIDLSNVEIQTLKLNNPSFDLINLTLNLYHEGFPGGDWTQHICIEVADPQAATNNQFPYNTWNIIVYDFTTTYGFDDICTLSVSDFEKLNLISVYPNPVQNKLWLDNPSQIKIEKVEILNVSGQIISSFTSVRDYLNVESLIAGVYFVRISNKQSSITLKVIKK
jgi:hypothetical protein